MKIAIDKNCVNEIKNFKDNEYIYIFDDEPLDYLLSLNLHCQNKDYIDEVDINLTQYNVECLKKTNIQNKDWYKMPEKKDYKFGIIIPNYNNDHGNYKGKTFFQNCIESVLNQTYKNFELIIVDDMSTDNSIKTVQRYNDDRIHLIVNKRKRYNGGSRNVGIEYALELNVDYICFLDSDDWWINELVLEKINRKLYNHEMLIFGCQMLFKNGAKQLHYNIMDNYADVYYCKNKIWCTAWSRVIRADKIVFFCEDTLMEDRVWAYKQADNLDFTKIFNYIAGID